MTKNKKKLRRAEKRYSVTKSAQTLVLAGMLLAGGVSGAMAATWAGEDNTVGAGDKLEVSTSVALEGTLTIETGGTVTVTSPGKINATQVNGQASTILMKGGTLTVTGYSDALQLQITGGTTNITGTDGNNWRADGLGGYRGVGADASAANPTTVSGAGTIVNITSANLFGGAADKTMPGGLNILDGAVVNLKGTTSINNAGILAAIGTLPNSQILTISGSGTTVNVAANNFGVLQAYETIIADGAAVNVDGTLLLTGLLGNGTVSDKQATAKAGKVTQTGGTVAVKTDGNLIVNKGVTYTLTGGSLTTAATGTVLVNGVLNLRDSTGTVTNAGSIEVVNLASGGSDMGRLEVTDTQLVQLAATGKVSVAGTSGSWGRIHLGNEATLDATKLVATASTGNVGVGNLGSIQAQNLTLTGATLAIDAGGRIKTNKLTLDAGGLAVTAGQIFLKGEQGSALTGGTLTLNGANAELKLGELSGAGVNPGGAIDASITATNGKVNVNAGDWILAAGKTLSLDSGSVLNVGGGTDSGYAGTLPAMLEIQGTLQSVDAGDVKVLQNGVLTGALDKFLASDGGNIATGLDKISVANGGTLWIKGEVSSDNLKDNADKLLATGSTGLVKYDKVNIVLNAAGNVDSSKVDGSQTLLDGATVETSAPNITGGYGADAVIIGGTGAATQNVNGDLTLLGGSGGSLITNKDGSEITTVAVAAGKNLNLGSAGAASKGGTLDSKVTLDGGSLNAAVANYKVGAVDGKDSAEGAVTASANANLTADSIGAVNGVASVEAKGGNVVSRGVIKTSTLTAENGGVQATTLTTTGNVALTAGGLNLTDGTNASTVGGTLGLNNTQAEVKELTVSGAATIDGGKLTGNKVTLSNGGTISNGAQVTVDTLVGATGKTIAVGTANDTEGGSSLVVTSLNMAGGSLEVDPAWGQASSNVAVGGFTGATPTDVEINGKVGVGKNSMAAIGTIDKTWLAGHVNAVTNGAGLTENGIDSALGIYTAQVLGTNNGIVVDGTKSTGGFTYGNNKLDFSGKSLLVVNAAGLNGEAALKATTTGTVSIADTAQLRVTGVQSGNTVKVLEDFTVSTGINADKGWSEKAGNLSTDSHMLYGVLNVDSAGNAITVGIKAREAQSMFPKLSSGMAGLVNDFYGQGLYDVESRNAGIKFMSRATNADMMPNTEQAAATIEGAAQLAVVGAAPAMTLSAVQAGTSTVTTRTSFASPLMDSSKAVALHKDTDGTLSVDSGLNAGNGMKNGFGLWIMPLYQSNSAWGMKADGFKGGYKSDLGGVALGADYTFNDMFRLGLAFNIGGGYAESNGDFNKTENSFNFWGINAYGGWTMNNFGITADVGYTGNYNKLQQEVPSGMGMSDIKSDVNSSAWTAGLRGEYKFATEALDIIPHVGVRYTGLTTDEYKAKSGGDTVFKVDQDFQSIWTFPIGVTLAKEIETGSGWIVRPQVDLGITPATGDVKAKSKVRIPGVDSQAEMKMQVVDYMSYDGGVGLEMKKDNISFGVNYNIQASEHRTGHGVFGTFRYEF